MSGDTPSSVLRIYLISASSAGLCFLESASLRTSLCAITKRIEDEKIGFTPIKSIILENAAEVEFAWNDDNTKCPVIEA